MRPPATIKPVARETRLRLYVLAAALFLIGLPLVVAPTRTDRWFSWTIMPPLTAATLGACYWGSLVLIVLCAREGAWARARVAAPGILTAGTLLLLATLLHLDRFHLDSATGWIWIVLYALLPPGAVLMLVSSPACPAATLRARRRSRPGPVRSSPFTRPSYSVSAPRS